MATKRRTRATRVRTLGERKLAADHARNVRGGYIGETEKLKSTSSRLPCDGSSKDPA
jgi:hypothetical protein